MTRLRQLAEGIAKWVCRNSPAGAKDWGAASERELGHIESDWEALRWAIGSTTVLLAGRRSALPIASVEQVPALAKCMARLVWRRTVLCAAMVAFEGYWCLYYLGNLHGLVLRAGAILIAAAMALIAVQAYLRRWRGMPGNPGGAALVAPLRMELERQRQFHCGGWLAARVYALMPGMLLLCCGVWTSEQTFGNAAVAFGLAGGLALATTLGTKFQLRTARGFECQIDALDRLEGAAEA